MNKENNKTSWKEAFCKAWKIPTPLFLALVATFIYSAIDEGLTWTLVRVYSIYFAYFVVGLYMLLVIYERYSRIAGQVVLALLFTIFALCSAANEPIAGMVRTFIQSVINLDFFIGCLTVAALLIALHEIKKDKTNLPNSHD